MVTKYHIHIIKKTSTKLYFRLQHASTSQLKEINKTLCQDGYNIISFKYLYKVNSAKSKFKMINLRGPPQSIPQLTRTYQKYVTGSYYLTGK
jgi:hypothetical protein